MGRSQVAVGIDLGTRYIRAAVVADRRPALVRDADGSEAMPAVVAMDGVGFRVGCVAEARAAMTPAMTVFGAKWWLGRRYDEAVALRGDAVDALPTQDGLVLLSACAYEPVEIVTQILRAAIDLAAAQIGERPVSAVLAAPPWLSPAGVAALRAAAASTGLAVDRVLAESAAIALALPALQKPVEQLAALVDVGAGGVSAAVLKTSAKEIVVLGASGHAGAGGDAVDRAIVSLFRDDLGARVPAGASAGEHLRAVAESLKRDLSEAEEASAVASALPGAPPLSLDRARLEPLLANLCARVDEAIAAALDEAGVTAAELTALHAAGGMAQVPAVRAQIERSAGRRAFLIHPSRGAVALGAAVAAAMLAGDIPDIPVLDLTSSTPNAREVPVPVWQPPPAAPRPSTQEISDIRPVSSASSASSIPPAWPVDPPSSPDRSSSLPDPPSWQSAPPSSSSGSPWSAVPPSSSGTHATPAALASPASSTSAPPSSSVSPPSSASALSSSMSAASAPSSSAAPAAASSTIAPPSSSVSPPSSASAPPPSSVSPPSSASAPASLSSPSSGVSPSRAAAPPLALGSGTFVRPADAAALLALPVARGPLTGAMTLPVLFVRLVAREAVTGLLTLSCPGKTLAMPVQRGRACLGKADLAAVGQAFGWTEGTYAFDAAHTPASREAPASILRLAVDGLRSLGRGFSSEELEAALGDRLDRAPVVRASAAAGLKRLGLTAGEARLVEHGFDGGETGRRLLRGGLGRHTTLELFVLLTLFDVIGWNDPVAKATESLAAQVTAAARKILGQNHFEALGVHWSASDTDIATAYRARLGELDPSGAWASAAPDACARMRDRVAAAYEVLRDPKRRMAHRREAYPLDFEAIADLVEQGASARALRQDEDGAGAQRRMAAELAKSADDSSIRKISMEDLLHAVAASPSKPKPNRK